MTSNVKIFSSIVVAAVAIGAIFGVRHLMAPAGDNVTSHGSSVTKEKREPGIVRFAPDAPQLSSLKVSTVTEVAMPISEPMNGRIAYDENVTARVTSPIMGRVLAAHAEIGDRVRRNAVLLDIDSPDLATADADWRKAQADEARKKLAFERSRNLFEHEVIARKDYESAEADYLQAAAETKRSGLRMKNLNATGTENGKFGLKAPIAGMIADKQVNPGLEVRPDLPNPLFVISDLNQLWVIVDVSERSIADIKPGQAVSVETDAYPNQRFIAKVDRVGLALDPNTRRIQVRCIVANTDNKLRPEMFARVVFLADGQKKGIQIPNTSLVVEGIYSYVFVEKSPGTFEKRRVNVSLRDRSHSFVDQDLANGERIVTDGALLLNSEVSVNAQ